MNIDTFPLVNFIFRFLIGVGLSWVQEPRRKWRSEKRVAAIMSYPFPWFLDYEVEGEDVEELSSSSSSSLAREPEVGDVPEVAFSVPLLVSSGCSIFEWWRAEWGVWIGCLLCFLWLLLALSECSCSYLYLVSWALMDCATTTTKRAVRSRVKILFCLI